MKLAPLFLLVAGCSPHASTEPPAAAPGAATSAAPATTAPSVPETPRVAAPVATPPSIAVPSGSRLVLKALAKGVQIYACKPTASAPTVYEWTLRAPEADLFDEKGQRIGRHYAGPTWQLADGSKVVGKLRSKADSPDATAIPWLLLDAKPTESTGALREVTYIQRVETSGGKAPASGCDAARSGAEARVDYSATYSMFVP